MAGWLHGVLVGDWLFVFPLCGFSLSLFCNYSSCSAQRSRGSRPPSTAISSRRFTKRTASLPTNPHVSTANGAHWLPVTRTTGHWGIYVPGRLRTYA